MLAGAVRRLLCAGLAQALLEHLDQIDHIRGPLRFGLWRLQFAAAGLDFLVNQLQKRRFVIVLIFFRLPFVRHP